MKTKYLAFAAAAFILASCSSDEDFGPQDNLKDTPITVTAGVTGLTTRAGYEGTTTLPEKFYLSIDQNGTTYDYTNVEMTKGTGNTYTTKDGRKLLWASNDRDVAVNAYTTDGTTFTVQTDQSTANGVLASDLLGVIYGGEHSDITINDDNISINFRHLLCKLDVTFTWGPEFQKENITGKTIKSVKYEGFGTDVTLDRTNCTVTKGTNTGDITAYTTTADNGVTYLSEAIFAPYIGQDPKIVIIADITTGTGDMATPKERVFSIGVRTPVGGFISGNRYTMNVTIGGTPVDDKFVTATIANGWEIGDANGDAEGTNGNMATK